MENEPAGRVKNILGKIPIEIFLIFPSQITLKSSPEQISIFQTVVSSNESSDGQVISFRFMADSRHIAAIMRGGDVIMVSVEGEGASVRELAVFPAISFSSLHSLK